MAHESALLLLFAGPNTTEFEEMMMTNKEQDTEHPEVIPITAEDLIEFSAMRRVQREQPHLTLAELFDWLENFREARRLEGNH